MAIDPQGLVIEERAAGGGQVAPVANAAATGSAEAARLSVTVDDAYRLVVGNDDAGERQVTIVQEAATVIAEDCFIGLGMPVRDRQAGDGRRGIGVNVEDAVACPSLLYQSL